MNVSPVQIKTKNEMGLQMNKSFMDKDKVNRITMNISLTMNVSFIQIKIKNETG